jgi:hypothetical protein
MLKSISKSHHPSTFSWSVNENSDSLKTDLISRALLLRRIKQRLILLTDDDLFAWSDIKLKLRNTFSFLTDEDLYLLEGKEDVLILNVLRKVGDSTNNLKKMFAVL